MKLILIIVGLLLLTGGAVYYFVFYDSNSVACSLDARICPDGSSVGRIPPDCHFAPCPDVGGECKIDEDCIHFGKTGECNCGCYTEKNLPEDSGEECFCLAPTSCKCVSGRCEGSFDPKEKRAEEPESEPEVSDGWQTYRSEEYGFEVGYPMGWKIQTNAKQNFFVIPSVRFVTQVTGFDIFIDPPVVDFTDEDREYIQESVPINIENSVIAEYSILRSKKDEVYWVEAVLGAKNHSYFISTDPLSNQDELDPYIKILSTFKFIE